LFDDHADRTHPLTKAISSRSLPVLLVFCWAILAFPATVNARADDLGPDDEIKVSYLYAAIMDSGTYEIRGRRITMFRIPFSYTQLEATNQSAGWKWLLPVTAGYDDLGDVDSDLIRSLLPNQLVTLTILPGFEYIYPVTPNWQLKPFLQLGGGRDFSIDETILMGQLGIRSLTLFEVGDDWELRWGNALRWAAEKQVHTEDRWGFGVFDTGLDLRRDTSMQLFGEPLNIGTYYIYQHMMPRWNSSRAPDRNENSVDLHEIGLSLGLNQQQHVLSIPVQRLRLGYKRGGGFKGWTIGTEFPF
jgi:hypothetical protein